MAVVPREHFDPIRVTLLHDSHLLHVTDLTILPPVVEWRARLRRINPTDHDILHSIICSLDQNI